MLNRKLKICIRHEYIYVMHRSLKFDKHERCRTILQVLFKTSNQLMPSSPALSETQYFHNLTRPLFNVFNVSFKSRSGSGLRFSNTPVVTVYITIISIHFSLRKLQILCVDWHRLMASSFLVGIFCVLEWLPECVFYCLNHGLSFEISVCNDFFFRLL